MCTLSLVGLIMTFKALAKKGTTSRNRSIKEGKRPVSVEEQEERATKLKQDLKKERRKWAETLKSRGLKTKSYPKLWNFPK